MQSPFSMAAELFKPLFEGPNERLSVCQLVDRAAQFVTRQEPSESVFPNLYTYGFLRGYDEIKAMTVQYIGTLQLPITCAAVDDYLLRNRLFILTNGSQPYVSEIPAVRNVSFIWRRLGELRAFMERNNFVRPGDTYVSILPYIAAFISLKKFNMPLGFGLEARFHEFAVLVGRGFALQAVLEFLKLNPNLSFQIAPLILSFPLAAEPPTPFGYRVLEVAIGNVAEQLALLREAIMNGNNGMN